MIEFLWIEFLWIVILIASVAGYYFAREARLGRSMCDGSRPARLWDRIRTWPMRVSDMELRWLLLIGILMLAAVLYERKYGFLRLKLNLLMFFEWHTTLMTVLLAISLAALLFAWRSQLTLGKWLAGAAMIGAVVLLLYWKWYCLLALIATGVLVGTLWAWRDRMWIRAFVGLGSVVFLVMALFLSHIFYTASPGLMKSIKLAAVTLIAMYGLYRGWRRLQCAMREQPIDRRARNRAWFLIGMSAFILLLIGLGVLWATYHGDVPHWFDIVGDGAQFLLTLIMISVVYSIVMSARWQPLGWIAAVMSLFLAGGLFLSAMLYGEPEDYADIEVQFKYGSIGSDHFLARGIPYYLWQALPHLFPPGKILSEVAPGRPEYLPRYGENHAKGKSYEAFGLWKEEGSIRVVDHDEDVAIDRPIGFSKRKVFGLEFIGMNCAFCHASTVRLTPQTEPQVVILMPSNTVDIELYFTYLFALAEQPAFKSGSLKDEWPYRFKQKDEEPQNLMEEILKEHPELTLGYQLEKRGIWGVCQEVKNSFQRLAYRWVMITLARSYLSKLKEAFAFIDPNNPDHHPRFGPGRVDAWSPGKRTLLNPPLPVVYPGGIIDDTSIWNQKARQGQRFHWDGNTNNIKERNIIAGLVVNGPQIEMLDKKRVFRITDWIEERPAPRFDDYFPPADRELYRKKTPEERMAILERGQRLFQHWCASCHAPDGDRVGRVEPIDFRELNTDRKRLDAFTKELERELNKITRDSSDDKRDNPDEGRGWKLRNFRMQDGYVNMLLDGIWARAPYLHNGSVPTLRALLDMPCEHEFETNCRPRSFYRGVELYDTKNVGFVSDLTKTKIGNGDTVEVVIQWDRRGNNEERNSYVVDEDGKITITGRTSKRIMHVPVESNPLSTAREHVFRVLRGDRRKELIDEFTELRGDRRKERIGSKDPVEAAEAQVEKEFEGVRVALILHRKNPDSPFHRLDPDDTTQYFKFDTSLSGNSNAGHLYGTDLTDPEKDALVEFMKSL